MKTVLKAGVAMATLTFAACASVSAFAADLHGYRGSVKDGPVVQNYSAPGPCYFRGDIGYSGSADPDVRWPVSNIDRRTNPTTFTYIGDQVTNVKLQDSWLGEVGVGCGSGSRGFRVEGTVGYRSKRKLDGEPRDFNVFDPGPATTPVTDDPLHTSITSYTAMLNVYKDLGRWGNFVPYLGAGLGIAYHKVDDVYFTGNRFLVNRIEGNNDVSFAWALMAGFGYQISDRAILDVGYRYINMGKVESGRVDSANFANPAVKIEDIAAHEFKVGLRYHFGSSGGCCTGGYK